jgi:hypothetical protein
MPRPKVGPRIRRSIQGERSAPTHSTPAPAVDDCSPMGQPHLDAPATRVTPPAGEDQYQWTREDFSGSSTPVENLASWARWKYKLPDNRDDQTAPRPAKLLDGHRDEFGIVRGIDEKTMGPMRNELSTEKQRRGDALPMANTNSPSVRVPGKNPGSQAIPNRIAQAQAAYVCVLCWPGRDVRTGGRLSGP